MKAVLQRVTSASVTIKEKEKKEINQGLVVLLGITKEDNEKEVSYLSEKISGLRIFEDEEGKMNKSLKDINGEMLIISQFTLYADCKKGKRPSFTDAARPEVAIPLYESFINKVSNLEIPVQTGEFGADMLVSINNDGPVTIILDTKELISK